MKLKNLMREYLEEETSNLRSGQFGSTILRENLGFPCKVTVSPSWEDLGNSSSKDFSLPCRKSMRSFCSYIMDLEEIQGVHTSLKYNSESNVVSIEVPHKLLGGNHFLNFFRDIDNIYQDVSKSY